MKHVLCLVSTLVSTLVSLLRSSAVGLTVGVSITQLEAATRLLHLPSHAPPVAISIPSDTWLADRRSMNVEPMKRGEFNGAEQRHARTLQCEVVHFSSPILSDGTCGWRYGMGVHLFGVHRFVHRFGDVATF